MMYRKFLIMLIFMTLLINAAVAKPQYAVKESRNCPYCHTREGPPSLNDIGIYYASNNHSLTGFVFKPAATPTPTPTEKIEIGVHMNTWDVGIKVLQVLLIILVLVFALWVDEIL